LRPFVPEHLLVGHGAPLHGPDAAGGLIDALARSRADMARLLLTGPATIRGMLGRH
jgi:hypothetical protein